MRATKSSFERCRDLEEKWEPLFTEIINRDYGKGFSVYKNSRSRELTSRVADMAVQKAAGDYTIFKETTRQQVAFCETKVESRFTGNLFIETHSNFSDDPNKQTLGWFFTSDSDFLWYGFDDVKRAYKLDTQNLRHFLLEKLVNRKRPSACALRLSDYPERAQSKHSQRNLTVGRLVPIKDLISAGVITRIEEFDLDE